MLGNMISPEEYCREFQGNKCNLKVPIPCNRCGTDLFNKLYPTFIGYLHQRWKMYQRVIRARLSAKHL